MTFWQLVSLLCFDQAGLDALLHADKWGTYLEWYHDLGGVVRDRTKLEAVIPEDLAVAAMTICRLRFQPKDDLLHSLGVADPTPDTLSALEAYRQFGATTIEQSLERGRIEI